MKKLLAIMAVLILLVMTSCGSDSGSDNSKATATANVTVGSSGGSVQLGDGANVTIPANVVADDTSVTIKKLAQPQLNASQAIAITDTYQIDIPGSNIINQSESNDYIIFQIPVNKGVGANLKKALSVVNIFSTKSESDIAFNATEVTIYNGSDTISLYGSYVESNGTLTIEIPTSAITSNSNLTSIKITAVNLKQYFPSITAAINDVTSSSKGNNVSFTEVSNDQTSKLTTKGQTKTPIILIHGWQIFDDASDPQSVWKNLVNYLTSDSDFNDNFKLYSFTYDTTQFVDYNGNKLAEKISSSFPSQNVIIIGHSMGGLVAHSYIQNHGGGSKVIKLITLGTPYHGSPLVQYFRKSPKAWAALIDALTTLDTNGATDLEWDKYDENPKISNPEEKHLSELNDLLNKHYANLYTAFYGNLNISTSHGFYEEGYSILKTKFISGDKFKYESDGIVPEVSAFNDGHPSGFVTIGPESDYDHHQICAGKTTSDPLFAKIKKELPSLIPSTAETGYTITGQITYKGFGLLGVYVSLAGTSYIDTTDSGGHYSFERVVSGSYTVTPSFTGYTFYPSSTTVNINGENIPNIDFLAIANAVTYTMSGTIHIGSNSGVALSGATVSIAGLTTTTNSAGTFSITGIPSGTYSFSISKSGYNTYTNSLYYVGSDQIGINFYLTQTTIPTYIISGSVSGAVVSGVTITLTGTGSSSTITDSMGNYSFINAANGSYSITPSQYGYAFSPSYRNITVNNANITGQNFMTSTISGAAINLPQTGQTTCYDASGTEITCAGTGQDGEIRAGVAWPDPRFVDNGDGTITDKLTGLMWLKDANCAATIEHDPDSSGDGSMSWQNALDFIKGINNHTYNISDCSSYSANYSDWHLPNINELESLLSYGTSNIATWLGSSGFTNIQNRYYWSATSGTYPYGGATYAAVKVLHLQYGFTAPYSKAYSKYNPYHTLPVRQSSLSAPAKPWRTGQTLCYSSTGAVIECAGTGQDGEIQAGTPWPQPRFKDNGDGTVTDNLSGLMWTKNNYILGDNEAWQAKLDKIAQMNTGQRTNYGYTDWRLPNIKELRTLMSEETGSPTFPLGHPFTGICNGSWANTTSLIYSAGRAWMAGFHEGGNQRDNGKTLGGAPGWPVRTK